MTIPDAEATSYCRRGAYGSTDETDNQPTSNSFSMVCFRLLAADNEPLAFQPCGCKLPILQFKYCQLDYDSRVHDHV